MTNEVSLVINDYDVLTLTIWMTEGIAMARETSLQFEHGHRRLTRLDDDAARFLRAARWLATDGIRSGRH